jgi:DNA-binding Xre family transcriptional regulator
VSVLTLTHTQVTYTQKEEAVMLKGMSMPAQMYFIFKECGYTEDDAKKKIDEIEKSHGGVENIGEYWCTLNRKGVVEITDEMRKTLWNYKEQKGIGKKNLAYIIGFSEVTLHHILAGKTKMLTIESYRKIRNFMDREGL